MCLSAIMPITRSAPLVCHRQHDHIQAVQFVVHGEGEMAKYVAPQVLFVGRPHVGRDSKFVYRAEHFGAEGVGRDRTTLGVPERSLADFGLCLWKNADRESTGLSEILCAGRSKTCPRRRSSPATNGRRGGQVGAALSRVTSRDVTQQAIAASIAASVAALISAAVSAFFGYRAAQLSKADKEHERLLEKQAKELRRCYRQVAAFHELESRACKRIAAATGENATTVQKSLRAEVEQSGLERPAITRTEAEKRLAEIEA